MGTGTFRKLSVDFPFNSPHLPETMISLFPNHLVFPTLVNHVITIKNKNLKKFSIIIKVRTPNENSDIKFKWATEPPTQDKPFKSLQSCPRKYNVTLWKCSNGAGIWSSSYAITQEANTGISNSLLTQAPCQHIPSWEVANNGSTEQVPAIHEAPGRDCWLLDLTQIRCFRALHLAGQRYTRNPGATVQALALGQRPSLKKHLIVGFFSCSLKSTVPFSLVLSIRYINQGRSQILKALLD